MDKLRFFRANVLVTISLMLLMAFVAYLLAESLHVSGVITAVVLALGMSRLSREKFPDKFMEQSRNFGMSSSFC